MTSALERRVQRLEAANGCRGECPRCVGAMTIVSDAFLGRFHSASWNGEPLSEQEARERKTERECPRCGRRIDSNEGVEIRVGGRRGA